MVTIPGASVAPVVPPKILPAAPVFDTAFWVAAAENAVRNYCGWHVAPIQTRTVALNGQGRCELLLPTMKLRAVDLVMSGGIDVTARVEASAEGILELHGGFARGVNSVVATFTDGYAPEEAPDILAIIAAAASRFSSMFGNAVQSQSAGGSSVTYFAGADALLRTEQARLDQYKLRGRA